MVRTISTPGIDVPPTLSAIAHEIIEWACGVTRATAPPVSRPIVVCETSNVVTPLNRRTTRGPAVARD
jgi:hypothetical protein